MGPWTQNEHVPYPVSGGADLPPLTKRPPLLRYGVAALAVGLTLLLKLLLDPFILQDTPFLLVFAAIMVGAWYGGLGPGLLATALGALAIDYFFLYPAGSFSGLGLKTLPLGVFVLEGVLVSSLVAALRSARYRAEVSTQEVRSSQEDLRRSEERFRSLVRNSSDIVMILDADGTITYESPAVERILGHNLEERIGANAFEYIHPEDVGRVRSELAGLAEEPGACSTVEFRARDKEGRWHHFEAIGNNLLHDPAIGGIVVNSRDVTGRKRTEEQLNRSHALLQSVVEGTSDAIYVKDARGCYLLVNSSCAEVIGRDAEEILGEDDTKLFPPEAARSFMQVDRRVMQTGETLQIEERVPEGGALRTFLSTKAAYRDHRGEVAGIIGVSTDITRRKRFEEALEESEERYRAVVEQAAEGIYLSDAHTKRVLDSNAAFRDLLGYTSEEVLEMTVYDIVAHDKESVDSHSRRILEKRSHCIGERRYRRKDGSLVDVEVNTSVISYRGRDVVCAVAHDVTERKRAEERTRRSLNSLLALYEAGQILGSTLEREEIGSKLLQIVRRISYVDAAAINLLDEQGQLRAWHAVGPESLWDQARRDPEARAACHAVLETEEHRSFRLRRSGPDEARLAGLCVPLRVRDRLIGTLEAYGPETLAEKGIVETLVSLTSQAAGALENARLYGELAKRERQLHDLVGRLFAAQEEERRRVAYDVHDGLTQVAVASYQHLQAFAEDHPPHSARGQEQLDLSLELAQQTVGEARRVISGLRPTALDDFGLSRAVRSQVEALRSEGWRISYQETLGDERLPAALETALFRIVQEALTNVRKHAQTTRVDVALQLLEGRVRLRVEDWGRGFQLAAATDGGGPGERVGLSSMRERVSLLGGDFEIHSKPDEGTSVVAEVPVPEEDADREG